MSVSPTARPVRSARRSGRAGIGFLHLVGGITLVVGLATVVGALFLPWLSSGPATRNSFQLMGLADRYRFFDAWWYRLAPEVWPLWGPVAVAVLLLLALRLRRCAAASGAIVGLLAIVVGSLVLIYGGGRSIGGVRLVDVGATTLVIGGCLACVGAVMVFGPSATRITRVRRP